LVLPEAGKAGKPCHFKTRTECDAALAVAADVLAELAVEFGGLLHSVFEHGAPLFGVVVEGDGAEQEAGLENDFEGVAEVVGEAANLFGLLLRDGFGLHG